VSSTVGHTHQLVTYRLGEMELRPRPGISGPRAKPRATSLGRAAEMDNENGVTSESLVNPPSSATGLTRDGKSSSRIHFVEGGRTRTSILPPAVRVGEEPSGRPNGTRPVARDKPGKAATWAGKLRPIDYL